MTILQKELPIGKVESTLTLEVKKRILTRWSFKLMRAFSPNSKRIENSRTREGPIKELIGMASVKRSLTIMLISYLESKDLKSNWYTKHHLRLNLKSLKLFCRWIYSIRWPWQIIKKSKKMMRHTNPLKYSWKWWSFNREPKLRLMLQMPEIDRFKRNSMRTHMIASRQQASKLLSMLRVNLYMEINLSNRARARWIS